MRLTLVRLVGALALCLLPALVQIGAPHGPTATAVTLGVWTLAGYMLLTGRSVREACITLAVFSLAAVLLGPGDQPPFVLLMWLTLILAATEGRPSERAALVRVCVTVVYVFTALTKLNPAFLAGDQLLFLVQSRPHLADVEALVSSWAVLLAAGVVVAELCLPLGLWYRRTRRATAALGMAMHLAFVVVVPPSALSALYLLALNGLLVSGYLAFFHDAEAETRVADVHPSAAVTP